MTVAPLKLPFLTEERIRDVSRSNDEPGWLLGQRLDALRQVESLPAESNQLFTPYLDLRQVRFGEIDPYERVGHPGIRAGTALGGASAIVHMDEDGIREVTLGADAQGGGVTIRTFSEALRDDPERARAWLEDGAALPENDAFAQVALAGFELGLLIHVPDGVRLEGPIVVRSSIGAPGKGLISRTLVVLGMNAHATLLEELLPDGSATGSDTAAPQSLWWGTSEVRLGDGATLDVSSIQEFGPSTVAIVNRDSRIGRDAALRWSLASIGAVFHKSRIDNRLEGRGSSVRQVEIAFGAGSQLFDLTSYTRHIGQDTTGDLLSKGVFLDRSRGYIKGLIEIQKSARGTDSFLGEFSMLLDRKARSVTIPSLEIDQPDVRRAAHSSSAGPIDETQTFYLMSRGIDRETARKFIVLGFLEPVVARVPLADAQERLRQLLEEKWPSVANTVTTAAA